MNVADIQVFSRVARLGSFSEAARQLGLTRSAVSKSVSRLEEKLGVVLIQRSTRSSSLTDAGRRFQSYAAEIDATLEKAVASVSGADQEVVGNLSVSVPTSFGAGMMPSLIHDFRAKWPRLSLNLHFSDQNVDLVGGAYDVAIRLATRLEDSSLLSKRLGTTREILVASPGYLARHGTPRHVNDLKSHRCLAIGSSARSQVVWRFRGVRDQIEVPIDCAMTSNTDLALILAACMDEGILYTPELSVSGELARGRLQAILPDFCDSRRRGIHAVYPNRKPPAKVRAFIDFIEAALPALEAVDRWAPFGEPLPAAAFRQQTS